MLSVQLIHGTLKTSTCSSCSSSVLFIPKGLDAIPFIGVLLLLFEAQFLPTYMLSLAVHLLLFRAQFQHTVRFLLQSSVDALNSWHSQNILHVMSSQARFA